MNGFDSPDDQQPVTWLRGYPIYAAHLVVGVLVASLLVTTLLIATDAHGALALMPLRTPSVWQGEVWRLFTYGLHNPPSLGFAIDMLMIAWFGRELERSLGRRQFLRLYLSLYLLPALLVTVLGLWRPLELAGQTGAFALFVAFATLYPNAAMLFNLVAKWVALGLFALFTLMALADHDWVRLVSLWATCAFAYGSVRAAQGRLIFPAAIEEETSAARVQSLPKTRSVVVAKPAEDKAMAEIDALLDKIAQSGMHSLTPKERARLEAARETLRKRS